MQRIPVSALLMFVGTVACAQTETPATPTVLRGMEPDMAELDLRETPVVRAVRRAQDAVVSIYLTRERANRAAEVEGQGSGVVIDANGLVITNWHVVAPLTGNRRSAFVRMRNDKTYPAELLSVSPENDLALLQIKTSDRLKPIVAGDSDSLMVGETVIAIGNPQGLSHTVTVGVLSSTDRSITVRTPDRQVRKYSGLLQTDAAINQGNSGGALLDITGKLIGINNAMAVGVENIGYAIPVGTVRKVFEEVLVSSENLATVWLGMRVTDDDGAAVVAAVAPQGPAERAGIRRGDRILSAGDRDVTSALDYARATLLAETGDEFPLRVQRNSRSLSVGVRPMSRVAWELMLRTGLEVETVTADQDRKLLEAASLELYSGSRRRRVPLLPAALRVVRVRPDSPADELSLRANDVVIAASVPTMWGRYQYRPVRSIEELADLARDRAGGSLNILLMRDGEGLEGPLGVAKL